MKMIPVGDPGSRWLNQTDFVWWQLECSLINTCSYCLPFHMQIAEHWDLPKHRFCRCRQTPVAPGEYAEPWANLPVIVGRMDKSKRERFADANKVILPGMIGQKPVVTGKPPIRPVVAPILPELPEPRSMIENIMADAQAVLRKLGPKTNIPDFGGSKAALESWVKQQYPNWANLSNDDWPLLFIILEAQRELRRVSKKLKADPDKAMKAMDHDG